MDKKRPALMIERFNYKPEKKSKLRKQSLKKAITKTDFDTIYLSLKEKQKEMKGYKLDRIESDLNWMEKECRKGRFQTNLVETNSNERLGSKFHKRKAVSDNL